MTLWTGKVNTICSDRCTVILVDALDMVIFTTMRNFALNKILSEVCRRWFSEIAVRTNFDNGNGGK